MYGIYLTKYPYTIILNLDKVFTVNTVMHLNFFSNMGNLVIRMVS